MSDPLAALTLALEETEGEWRGCGSASWMAKVVWPVMEAHMAAPPSDAAAPLDVDAYLDSIFVMTAEELRRRWPASVERLLRESDPAAPLREGAQRALSYLDTYRGRAHAVVAARGSLIAALTPEADRE